ncbi:unnamed protein product [Hyaloperonospora brassicae]|uniref:Homeobox domain-containing protein n=1 Tax=Hyaloperonospora brassicae TaxID=162125 RepID=A0AAV0T987_HYABA|nr:unnamed protein product [Hyaloperonospora brassicae]
MTFPNRINYCLRSREPSRQPEHQLTASDDPRPAHGTPIPAASDLVTRDDNDNVDDKASPTSLHNHALLPLTHKLMAMISQPATLLAALVANCDQRTSRQVLWAKATAYQHAQLQGLCTSWYRIMEDIDQYELSATDLMVLKAVLYYWRMWQFVCTTCIDAVASIEASATSHLSRPQVHPSTTWVSLLQKRRTASISPPLEDKCSDALSQGMVLSGSGLSKRSRITKKSNEFLVAWFLAHKDNPYPSPDERVDIATRTGLAEQQVRNWFANMRKRHWKPNRANAKKPRCLLDYVLRQSESTHCV